MSDPSAAALPAPAPSQDAPAPAEETKVGTPGIAALFLDYVGEAALLLGQTVRLIARGGVEARTLLDQMTLIGANSVPIAMLTSLMSGAVISLYFTPFLKQYGAESLSGGLVTLALVRELVPVLTGVVIAARAGSTIAAELGTMKVTEQIDALRALAVSPVQYLVVPRLLAALVMLPVVCAMADAIGIVGGYLVAHYYGVTSASFPASIRQLLLPRDFYLGMVKTIVFGLIVAVIGCQEGLKTEGGATEVGRATTNAVVISIVLIYISNFFLAAIMFPRTTNLL